MRTNHDLSSESVPRSLSSLNVSSILQARQDSSLASRLACHRVGAAAFGEELGPDANQRRCGDLVATSHSQSFPHVGTQPEIREDSFGRAGTGQCSEVPWSL